jgi:hypothetical protein
MFTLLCLFMFIEQRPRTCDAESQILEAATAAAKKTDKLQSSLQVSGAAASSCVAQAVQPDVTRVQALQAQLDRVASSQPMKRQETAADAEV